MTTPSSGAARAYSRKNGEKFLNELIEMLRIPSLSGDPAHAGDVRRMAEWLAAHLTGLGVDRVEVMETAGHPVVYGEWLGAGPDKPTVLVYGHYDVVPAALEDGWDSDPFEPVVRDGRIFARGATDDKGQLFVHVKALESYLETAGAAPVNIKLLLEGEEEVSSPNLTPFIKAHLGDAARRCGGGQRLVHAQHRRAGHHAQPARHDLHRGRGARPARGPAQRAVGRRGAQPRDGPGADPG
jgi:acetylornithine deacetylase/succinyl-diaminopimelate desuccinylase-like protein